MEIKSIVQPIVKIGYIAQKTAALDRTDRVLLGWHRAKLIQHRLDARVAQMLKNTRADGELYYNFRPHLSWDRSRLGSQEVCSKVVRPIS